MEPIHISQTLSITNHRVFSADLNEHDTVFGGKILATIDDNSSIAASRVARIETVTVSVDQVNFYCRFGYKTQCVRNLTFRALVTAQSRYLLKSLVNT